MTSKHLWALLASTFLWSQSPPTSVNVFSQNISQWQILLDRGLSTNVREDVLVQIDKYRGSASSNPNDAVTLIALKKVLSRAYILDGNWEEGLRYLDEALESSRDNVQTVEELYAVSKKDHENAIKTAKESIDKYNTYLRDLQSVRQLTSDQKRRKQELEIFINDQRLRITQSMNSLDVMKETMKSLRQDKDEIALRILSWRVLLEQEKKDKSKYKSTKAFIDARISQIKSDTIKPLFDRRSYAARLVLLDPAHVDARSLQTALLNTSIQ